MHVLVEGPWWTSFLVLMGDDYIICISLMYLWQFWIFKPGIFEFELILELCDSFNEFLV